MSFKKVSDYVELFSLLLRGNKTKEIKNLNNNYIDPSRFSKFGSIQPLVAFLFDVDTTNLKKTDTRIGVFTRALEDRGVDSLGNNFPL